MSRFTVTRFASRGKSYGATSGEYVGLEDVDSYGDGLLPDSRPIVDDQMTSYEKNLYLYHEEMPDRPRVSTLLSSLVSYNVAIPSVDDAEAKAQPKKANLGTVAGVYLPCIQNIFGVIFFIRLVWIVGVAGVPQAFLIVLLSCCVTFTTCISLSAIATNGIVPAGGSYFMISRALGPEFGGAVGILFYLATSFAGAMYITGAVEIFLNYMAPSLSLYGDFRTDQQIFYHNIRTYGTILLVLVGIVVFIGVKFVSKFAPIALFCVIISIFSVYVGVFTNYYGNKLEYCKLGDRILSTSAKTMSCTKDKNDTASLFHIYCQENGTSYACDPYYEQHEPKWVKAIPGLASGVFSENVGTHYWEKGEYISFKKDEEKETKRNQIVADITTTFTLLVAIFFPSCTGIMAGSNRSGDLEDAQKAIPTGTLAAQLTTTFVYLSGVLLFGASFDNLFLRDKFGDSIGGGLAVARLSWPHPMVIVVGSFLSTIGAGLQSLTGAPRLLQAIAKDQIIPLLNVFSVSSARNEPTRALFLTLAICEIGILIGNLDYIAPILTMFFLMCYMFVNLACTLQSLLRAPNWRPRFRYYHWSLSLLGVALCLVVMFLSSWYYALAAIAIAGLIYKYIEYRGAEKEWGDGIHGLALSAARYSLLKLEEGPPHTKNWRPQVLLFCKLDGDLNPMYPKLFAFASQLKAGKGLSLVCSVLEGEYSKMFGEAQAAKLSLRNMMDEERVKGFADVVVAKNVSDGICHLIQTSGLGGMKPNTVIIGWPYRWRQSPYERSWKIFLDAVRQVSASKNALLVPKGINQFPDSSQKLSGSIDIWWIVHDGGLLMLLPFLLKQNKTWRNCNLRIFTVAQLEDNSIQMKKDLSTFLYHLRIEAEVEVVEMMDSDISAYTYERTLMMEQRSEMVKHMRNRRDSLNVLQSIVDDHFVQRQRRNTKVRFTELEPHPELPDEQLVDVTSEKPEEDKQERSSPEKQDTMKDSSNQQDEVKTEKNSFDKDLMAIKPDEANVRRMHTAVKLNEAIVNKSHDAQLVIINLPGLPKTQKIEANYMEFLEVLTEGLERVLMVRGGGREVITIYS